MEAQDRLPSEARGIELGYPSMQHLEKPLGLQNATLPANRTHRVVLLQYFVPIFVEITIVCLQRPENGMKRLLSYCCPENGMNTPVASYTSESARTWNVKVKEK